MDGMDCRVLMVVEGFGTDCRRDRLAWGIQDVCRSIGMRCILSGKRPERSCDFSA